jgi:hypothetical protein
MAFWYDWPSWITELLGGATLSGLLCLGLKYLVHLSPEFVILLSLGGGFAISVVYEYSGLDPNKTIAHRPKVDIAQRLCGQVLGLIIWSLFQ